MYQFLILGNVGWKRLQKILFFIGYQFLILGNVEKQVEKERRQKEYQFLILGNVGNGRKYKKFMDFCINS